MPTGGLSRSIRSVTRSLEILEFLNLRNGATQREVCAETGLTRGTAYRMLETMRLQGFLRKDAGSARYWLTGRVRALADGYVEEWWIEAFARQMVQELGRRVRWPVKLLTLSGHELLTRVTTDYESPFTEAKFPSGHRVSLLGTAAGHAFLSVCDPTLQEQLIRMAQEAGARSRGKKVPYKPILRRVRAQGYEIVDHPRLSIYSVAIPVVADGQVIGALAIQLFRAAVPKPTAVAKFLAELQTTAAAIGAQFKLQGVKVK
jgi:IclR family mhp operon transcriptional activator